MHLQCPGYTSNYKYVLIKMYLKTHFILFYNSVEANFKGFLNTNFKEIEKSFHSCIRNLIQWACVTQADFLTFYLNLNFCLRYTHTCRIIDFSLSHANNTAILASLIFSFRWKIDVTLLLPDWLPLSRFFFVYILIRHI